MSVEACQDQDIPIPVTSRVRLRAKAYENCTVFASAVNRRRSEALLDLSSASSTAHGEILDPLRGKPDPASCWRAKSVPNHAMLERSDIRSRMIFLCGQGDTSTGELAPRVRSAVKLL